MNVHKCEVTMQINDLIRALIVITLALLIYNIRKAKGIGANLAPSYRIRRSIIISLICTLPIFCYIIMQRFVSTLTLACIMLILSVTILVGIICYYIWETKNLNR